MVEFLVVRTGCPSIQELPIEIVERKGLGHPDTIADGVAESISIAYSQYCLQEHGAVLHHNVDKTIIGGGHFRSSFGSYEMIAPVTIILGGRMSTSFGGEPIDTRAIQENAARQYISEVLPELDALRHLRFEHYTSDYSKYPTWFHPRSLDDLPELENTTASDTSVAVGFWPLTPTERLAVALEVYLNASQNTHHKFLGQDIKVMVYRNRSAIHVIMCVPFLSRFTPSLDCYLQKKKELRNELLVVAQDTVGSDFDIELELNTSENNPFREKSYYVSALGSCIDCGDEGVVGRGNPPMGVISTYRPHSMEPPYGKNPVYHSGKVYGYLTNKLAKEIGAKFSCECTVYAITRHSDPLIPPAKLIIETSANRLDERELDLLLEEHLFDANYFEDIVQDCTLLPTVTARM